MITFDNPDTSILPGFSVKIECESTITDSVSIPIKAINYDSNGYYVITVSNSDINKKYIKEILFNNGEYTVCSGLESGEKIIINKGNA